MRVTLGAFLIMATQLSSTSRMNAARLKRMLSITFSILADFVAVKFAYGWLISIVSQSWYKNLKSLNYKNSVFSLILSQGPYI